MYTKGFFKLYFWSTYSNKFEMIYISETDALVIECMLSGASHLVGSDDTAR